MVVSINALTYWAYMPTNWILLKLSRNKLSIILSVGIVLSMTLNLYMIMNVIRFIWLLNRMHAIVIDWYYEVKYCFS